MSTIDLSTKLFTIHCCECSMLFAMPDDFDTRRRNDYKTFYCPAGHSQSYQGESDVEKARRERDIARQQVARVEEEKRKAIAAKDREIAAMKKRSAAGSCPCCKRTFSNMSEHMKKQHPQFVAENVVPIKRKKSA